MHKLKGVKKVFNFTLAQMLKAKSSKVTLVILFLAALLTTPISALVTNSSSEKNKLSDKIEIKNIYYFNNTDYKDVDFDSIIKNDSHTKNIHLVKCVKKDFDEKKELIDTKEDDSIILSINKKELQYNIESLRKSNSSLKKSDIDYVANLLKNEFDSVKFASFKGNKKSLKDLSKPIAINETLESNEIVEKQDQTDSESVNSQISIINLLLFVSYFIVIFSSSKISAGIATDKSTRVIEYIMTSVKPLSLLIGKIIAALCYSLIEILGIILCMYVSNIFTQKYISSNTILSNILSDNLLPNFKIEYIVIGIIAILLGLIFYAILAGLCGSTVSKLEELKNALTLYNIAVLVGFYLAFFFVSMQLTNNIDAPLSSLQKFVSLFPLSSPFILPGMALCGKVGLVFCLIGILILLLSCILLMLFTSKVYTAIIMYTGNRIKPSDFISIYKGGMKNE